MDRVCGNCVVCLIFVCFVCSLYFFMVWIVLCGLCECGLCGKDIWCVFIVHVSRGWDGTFCMAWFVWYICMVYCAICMFSNGMNCVVWIVRCGLSACGLCGKTVVRMSDVYSTYTWIVDRMACSVWLGLCGMDFTVCSYNTGCVELKMCLFILLIL